MQINTNSPLRSIIPVLLAAHSLKSNLADRKRDCSFEAFRSWMGKRENAEDSHIADWQMVSPDNHCLEH